MHTKRTKIYLTKHTKFLFSKILLIFSTNYFITSVLFFYIFEIIKNLRKIDLG